MAIDGKMQGASIRARLNVNRRIGVVHEFQVFQSFCNRRIHRRIHIVDNHGMAVPLRHLKFRFQNRNIKRCGNLADTAAVRIDDLAHLIRCRQCITIFRIKRHNDRLYGKFLARLYQRSVNLLCADCDILFSAARTVAILRRTLAEQIFDKCKLLRIAACRCFFCYQFYAADAAPPACRQVIDNLRRGLIHVDAASGLARIDDKFAVFAGQRCICCLAVQHGRVVFYRLARCLAIDCIFQGKRHRLSLFEPVLCQEPLQYIAFLPDCDGFSCHLRVGAGKSEIPCCHLCILLSGRQVDNRGF